MLNPAHLLEIAMLLLVAFLCGAVIGSLARLVFVRLARGRATSVVAPVASPAAAPADGTSQAVTPALVAAPVIAEVVKTPAPAAPADVPAPDFTEALLALAGDKPGALVPTIHIPRIAPLPDVAAAKPTEQMAPARVAGATTSGRAIAHPRAAAAAPAASVATGASAEVIPFPVERAAADPQPTPVVVALQPLPAGTAETVPLVADDAAPAQSSLAPPAEQPPAGEPVAIDPALGEPDGSAGKDVDVDAAPVLAEPTDAANVANPLRPDEASDSDGPAPLAVAVVPTTTAEDDEAAAMRAIEGNWSPRRATVAKVRRAELPELAADEAVRASGAAVSSAARAAELAVGLDSGEPPGKPEGLAGPRLGAKDDLAHVIGILPIIETALNRLGLYHFDQIADLTDENAAWIETHLGISGRIGREHWREQAREIAATLATAKKAAGN